MKQESRDVMDKSNDAMPYLYSELLKSGTAVCAECPHCKEEIEIQINKFKLLIGEEGTSRCPSCKALFDYEIHVLTTK